VAVKSVQCIWNSGIQGSADQRGMLTAVLTFRVRTTSKADGKVIVSSAVDPISGLTIPYIFSSYVDPNGNPDSTCICGAVDPQLQRDPTEWLVTCRYSNFVEGSPEMAQIGYVEPNPLLRPAIPRWGREDARRVATFDLGFQDPHGIPVNNLINGLPQSGSISQAAAIAAIEAAAIAAMPPITGAALAALIAAVTAGVTNWSQVIPELQGAYASLYGDIVKPQAITNSTGQRFTPAPEIEDPRPTLALTWNIPAPLLSQSDGGTSLRNLGGLLQYQNSLFLDTFLTCAPSTVKLKTIDPGETRYEEGIYFQPVTAHFSFRFDTIDLVDDAGGTQTIVGWEIDEYVPDTGWYVLNATTGGPRKYVDPTGLNPGGPYPLNGSGQVLVNSGGGKPQQYYFLHYYFANRNYAADLLASVILV